MSWAEELIRLYDINQDMVGKIQERYISGRKKPEEEAEVEEEGVPYVLLPKYHSTVAAQIQVTIDSNGEWIRAEKVPEKERLTIIPVTEKSASRTVGIEPHPLCDSLKYVAGDYKHYVKSEKDDLGEYFSAYIEALEKWHDSNFSHEKVDAIWRYLKKGTLVEDLIREQILIQDHTGYLSDSTKIEAISQQDAFIRFIVRSVSDKEQKATPDECWKDPALWDKFIKYIEYIDRECSGLELDYLTGEMQAPAYFHSRKIRREGDQAKLISANDTKNFVFRGRFLTKEQALSIGSESSQKMHNALKWIIRKQGKSYDTISIVSWESAMLTMPDWDSSTDALIQKADEEQKMVTGLDNFNEELEEVYDTNPITASQLSLALAGYRKKIMNTSQMSLLAFDAATKGRLVLAEYKMLETSRYLNNIEKWHRDCAWIHRKESGEFYIGIPNIWKIGTLLYGIETDDMIKLADEHGRKRCADLARRLIPCIWDHRNIPDDLVNRAVLKASGPQSYKKSRNWNQVLSLACSFVKKHRCEREKEEWSVALNKESKVRDYLYGRLLAVADRIEESTFQEEERGKRITNAKRYWSAFSQRPFDTWKIIEENIQPYLHKLNTERRAYFEYTLNQIFDLFDWEDFQNNDRLDGLYLLGFHSQSYALWNPNKSKTKNTEEEMKNE